MGRATVKASESKKSKNQLRRERAKLLKRQKDSNVKSNNAKEKNREKKEDAKSSVEPLSTEAVTTEAAEAIDLVQSYKAIFDKFDALKQQGTEQKEDDKGQVEIEMKVDGHILIGSEAEDEAEDFVEDNNGSEKEKQLARVDATIENKALGDEGARLSKRKFKKLYSIPLAILKGESKYPELIDWMDANSPDPRLHIYLKTLPNSVSIPSHWQSKKSFLSSKRGIERPPFELPQFIRDTGILEMRNTVEESETEQSTLKQRMRERVQPKSGQLDIDYNKLHDAFFKYQKKPPLLKFGQLYTETTNNDDLALKDKISHFKVGMLSPRLKFALGMVDEKGALINRLPPWYYKMKELGPPPSYPYMKISSSGKITFDNPNELNIGPPIITEHWGMLVNDLDNSEDEVPPEEKSMQEQKSSSLANNEFDRSKGDVLLTAFGQDPTKKNSYSNLPPQPSNSSQKRWLFTVLQSTRGGNNGNEDDKNRDSSIFGSQTASYKLPQ